jgi:hypothetical protein
VRYSFRAQGYGVQQGHRLVGLGKVELRIDRFFSILSSWLGIALLFDSLDDEG